MPRTTPLTDCTNAMFQASNRMPTSQTPKPLARRHNPYECCLLAPEDSVEHSGSDMFGSPLTPNGLSSVYTDDTAGTQRGLSRYSTPYGISGGLGADNQSAAVHRALFNAKTPENGSPTPTPTKHATTHKAVTGWAAVAPGRACHYAEVTVMLRTGSAEFVVADIATVFGADMAAADLVGTSVLVDGDRGEDLGTIQSVNHEDKISADKSGELLKRLQAKRGLLYVQRPATDAEKRAFDELDQAEGEALEYSRACLSEVKLDVPITIERAIFQFDRKKLTLQYTSGSYVDFNALTRHLHNLYKCRIWMHQLNRDVQSTTARKNSRTPRTSKSS